MNRKKITDSDSAMIEAINGGDMESFEKLAARYDKKLYRFGLRLCGDTQDAEDLVQDTLLNVFRYLKNFRFETRFKNWLYRIATSVCIKKRRKSKFAPERELSLEEFLPGKDDPIPDHVPAWAQLPSQQVLNGELTEILHKAILDLPEKYRVVTVLRDIEGFSTRETAQILDITPVNVKVRLHRGRLFLRDRVKGYFKDEPQ